MSSFIATKLDIQGAQTETDTMGAGVGSSASSRQAARQIRSRVERGDARLWRMQDFDGLPPAAVAQALSRLAREGVLERVSKGIYYRPRSTAFGQSVPNPAAMRKLASRRKHVFPSGIAAAGLLGFTTQAARQAEVSTSALSLPRKLIGAATVVHVRRPEAWGSLSESDAALLEFLRCGGRTSELPPDGTVRQTLALISEKGRLNRLLRIADSEPPRVRALLGALAEALGKNSAARARLRATLNPYSRFDFGLLAGLPHTRHWQAKKVGRG